jgi:predicted nucleic acid-binding protein
VKGEILKKRKSLGNVIFVGLLQERKRILFVRTVAIRSKLSSKDAVHLACAYYAKCWYFLTCDDNLIKYARRLNLGIKIMNPVEYIREVGKQ